MLTSRNPLISSPRQIWGLGLTPSGSPRWIMVPPASTIRATFSVPSPHAKRDPSPMSSATRFKLFMMMFLEFFIWGAWLPLIFGYLPSLGFNAFQQSLILNTFPAAAILAMFFSNQFADRHFAAEKFLAVSQLIGGVSILALKWVTPEFIPDKDVLFYVFFALMLVHCIFYVPTISITNSIAFAAMKNAQEEFGIVRMGGTIGWIAAAWPPVFILVNWAQVPPLSQVGLSSWLDIVLKSGLTGQQLQDATSWTYVVAGAASILLAFFSFTLPHTPPRPATAEGEDQAWLKAMKLLGHPFVLVLWIVTCLDSFVHNCYFSWTGRFLPTVDIPGNWVTPVMSIGQIAEILTMAVLGLFLKNLGWRTTMILGILGHAARFAVFAFFGTPEFKWLIVGVNVLHGICYAFFFATVYIFVDEHFPKDVRSSAQGLFNLMILGIGALLANFICPPTFDRFTDIVIQTTVDGNAKQNEEQKVKLNYVPPSGSFQLGLQGAWTEPIGNGAPAAEVQSALERLEPIGKGNVNVSGASLMDGMTVSYAGTLANTNVDQLAPKDNRVHFRELFLIPCICAIAAAVMLALFFWPPTKKIPPGEEVPEEETPPVA